MTSAPVSHFLRELDQALSGGRRWRREVLVEIHAHLLDALDAAGDDPQEVLRIIEEFGDPLVIAQGLNAVDERFRRRRGAALGIGCAAATAIAAVAVSTMRTIQNDGGVAITPAPAALIGRIVAVAPATSETRLLLVRGGAPYSLVPVG